MFKENKQRRIREKARRIGRKILMEMNQAEKSRLIRKKIDLFCGDLAPENSMQMHVGTVHAYLMQISKKI